MDDFYCKIFINGDSTRAKLIELVRSYLNGVIELDHYIDSDYCSIDIKKNKEFDSNQSGNFLFFPYYAEIDIKNRNMSDKYIKEISDLINLLKKNGFDVVAACEFEDKL